MKLLLISYSFGAGRGSEAGVGWNVARGMCERGHDVTVVTTSEFHHLNAPAVAQMERPPRLIEWDCGITHFASSRSYRIWQRRIEAPLRELCRRERFDLAHHVTFNQYRHIHDVFATGLPYLIGPVGGAETIPLRLWRDLPWSTRFKELLRRIPWDVRLLTRRVRHSKSRGLILASTPQTLDRLTHTGGLSNVELMPIISIASNEIRDDAPTPADEPYLIFDGGLRPEKGLRMLLRSLAALHREGESIPLRIAAVRPEDQGTLLALARSRGLPEQWLQPMPFMKRSELLPIIRSARGFVSVGFRDAGCMALLEAVALGVSTLCLDLPGQSWLPDDYACKVPVTARTEEDLRAALKKIIHAAPLPAEWHRERARWLCEHMSWDVRLSQLENHYKHLLSLETL